MTEEFIEKITIMDKFGVSIASGANNILYDIPTSRIWHTFTFSVRIDEQTNGGQDFNVDFQLNNEVVFSLRFDNVNNDAIFTDDAGNTLTFSYDTTSYLKNHIAMTVSPTHITVFMDGSEQGREEYSFLPTRLDKIDIYGTSTDKTFVDSLRLRACILSDDQIMQEATTEFDINGSGGDTADFTGSDVEKSSEDTRYILVNKDNTGMEYMVLVLTKAITSTDCSLAYYHVFNKKMLGSGGFHHTYCGTNNLQRLFLTENVFIKFYSDSSLPDLSDKLEFSIKRGKCPTECPGSTDKCIEVFPDSLKCRQCATDILPLVHYDFQLEEGEVFQGRTVRDKSGNGYDGTFEHVVDTSDDAVDAGIVGETGATSQHVLKVKYQSPGLRVDLSSLSEASKSQFSLSFYIQIPTAGKTGDLVTFYNKNNERVMALMIVASGKVNFWTFKRNDYLPTITGLATGTGWSRVTLAMKKALMEDKWSVLYGVDDETFISDTNTVDLGDEVWSYLVIGQHNTYADTQYDAISVDDFRFYDCYRATAKVELRIVYDALKYESGKITLDTAQLGEVGTFQAIDSTITLPLLPADLVYHLDHSIGSLDQGCQFTVTEAGVSTALSDAFYRSKTGDVKVTYKCTGTSTVTNHEITVLQVENVPKNLECSSEFVHVENWYNFAAKTENMAGVLCPSCGPSKNTDPITLTTDLIEAQPGTSTNPSAIVLSGVVQDFDTTPTSRFKNAVTLMFWFKKDGTDFTTTAKTEVVALKEQDGGGDYKLFVEYDPTPDELHLRFKHSALTGTVTATLATLTASDDGLDTTTYSAYAFTVEAHGLVKVYVNGDLKKTEMFNYEEILPGAAAAGIIGFAIADNKIYVGELRVYTCVLPADIIKTVATRQYACVDATVTSTDKLEGPANRLTKFSTTGTILMFDLVERVVAQCGTQAALYGKAADTMWFNLCDAPLPLEYSSMTVDGNFKLWFVTSNPQDRITYRYTAATSCVDGECEYCEAFTGGAICLECSLDDLYTKTFLKIHPHQESQGLAADDTPFGNIGHKVGQVSSFADSSSEITFTPDKSYIFYKNVRGVPEFGVNINILLKFGSLVMPIMTVYDKNNNPHLTMELVNGGDLKVWIQNPMGEAYTFTTTTSFTTTDIGAIGFAITRHTVLFYDAFTDFEQTVTDQAASPTHFNLLNTDWSRVEIGRIPDTIATFAGEIYSFSATACLIPEHQRIALIASHVDTTVYEVLETKTYEPTNKRTEQVDVKLEECFSATVKPEAALAGYDDTGENQLLFIEHGRGNLSFSDCTAGCTLTSSTTLRYHSTRMETPKIQFTVDENECCNGKHTCQTECYDVVGSFACKTCGGEGRVGLLASTDFERINDAGDYRAKHSDQNTLYGTARTKENGVTTGTFAITIADLQAPFLSVHFWFKLTGALAETTLIQSTGAYAISIGIVDDGGDFKVGFSLGGGDYYADVVLSLGVVYEVAMIISPTKADCYVDGIKHVPIDTPTMAPIALGTLTVTDSTLQGFVQDVEIWSCEKEEYRSQTEMLHTEKTTAEGVIKADQGKSTKHEHIYNIKPTGVTDQDSITYKLTKNNLDCSYADVLVLEKASTDNDNKEWKSYCDPTSNIFGYTTDSDLYVKYVNYDFEGPVPDFYFQYITDSNECDDPANCPGPNTCTNTLSNFNCVDCSKVTTANSGFNGEHTLMFDFETVNDRTVTNAYTNGAPGMLGHASDVDGNYANHYLDATSPYKGKFTVDGQALNRIPSTSFTIAMFVKLEGSVDGVRPLFYSYGENGLPNILFELHDGKPYIELRGTDNNYLMTQFITTTNAVSTDGAWNFVGAVFAVTSVKLYVGKAGELSSSIHYSRPISQDWSGGVKIAHRDESTFLNGKLDDFRLVPCVLTQADIDYLVDTFTPDCALQTSTNQASVTTVTAAADTSSCTLQLPLIPPPAYYLITSGHTCANDAIQLKSVYGTVIDMCDDLSRPAMIAGQTVTVFYTSAKHTGRAILTYTLETDYCSPYADALHNCGDNNFCYNAEDKFICTNCLEEYGEQLRLYYDFEDINKILNKAPATKSDSTLDIGSATLAVDKGILNNGLMQQITTNLQFATGLDARFMLIAFWVFPDTSSSTKDTLFVVGGGEIVISITGSTKTIEAIVDISGETYTMTITVNELTDGVPSHVRIVFKDKFLSLHCEQEDDFALLSGVDRFDWTSSKEVKIGNSNHGIDEFRIYACATILPSFYSRTYVAEDLTRNAGVVTAPGAGITDDSYEARWYITKPDADKVIFVDFLSLPKDGVVKYRDETIGALADGRDLWVIVDGLHLVAFTESVVISYFTTSPQTEINGFAFDYFIDVNQCALNGHGCGTADKCVNVPGGHYCKECTPDNSLILHFDFETTSIRENRVSDLSVKENYGTLVNSIKTTATESPIGAFATFAMSEGIIVHNMRPVPTHTFTLATWVRLSGDVDGRRALFNAYDTVGSLVLSIDVIEGVLTFTLPGELPMSADSAIVAEKMVHLAVTISRESVAFYINGEPAGSNNAVDIVWKDDWQLAGVARKENRPLEYLRGDLDQFRIYNCYLSADYIKDTLFAEFDPDAFYCIYNGDKSLDDDTVENPDLSAGGYSMVDCKYKVVLDPQYVLYHTVTGADANKLQITETSGTGNTLTGTYIERPFTSTAVFSLQWTKDLNECYEYTLCGSIDCVDRLEASVPMCRFCGKYDENNLRIHYKFDYLVNNDIRNRVDGTVTGESVTISNAQIGSADTFDGHYLGAALEISNVPVNYQPSAAFTIFVRVITSSTTGTEDMIYESTFSTRFVKLYISGQDIKFEVKYLGETGTTTAPSAVEADKWTVVLATFEPDGKMTVKAKKEGATVTSTAATNLNNLDFPLDVWSTMKLSSANLKLDEFMFFDCALAPEVQDQLLLRDHKSMDLTDSSGKIVAPQYTDKKAIDHVWTIKRPDTHWTISLDIDNFNVNGHNGYLEIKTIAEGEFKRYHGSEISDAFRLIQDDVVVRYVRYNLDDSDDSFTIYYAMEVNECEQDSHDCEEGGCVNTLGSYHCRQCKNGEDDAILFLNFEQVNGIEISDANDKNVVAVSSAHDVLTEKTQSTCKNYLQLPTGRSIRVMADKLRYIPSNAFTIEMRVYLQETVGCHPLFQANHEDGRHIMQLDVEDGELHFKLMASDEQEFTFVSNNQPIKDTKWHHVSVTYDGAALQGFVDGVLVVTKAFTGQVNKHWSSLDVGTKASAPSLSLNGYVDEVKLYGCYVTGSEHLSCSLTTYYCDDTFADSPWQFPTSDQLTGYEAVDCSLTIPPGSDRYQLIVNKESIVCSNVEKFTYSLDGGEEIDYCADGHQWPEQFVVDKFNLHYQANSVTDSFLLLVHKFCGENEHYYPDEDVCNCENGYIKNDQNLCEDLNECCQSVCQENTVCINKKGTFSCQCLPGFVSKDPYSCKANDPCLKSPCGANEKCLWTNMKTIDYECVCASPGFRLVDGQCIEDNCVGVICETNAHCSNGACQCNEGYQENDAALCRDEDECDESSCKENEDCHNTEGSFICTCMKGYAYNHIEKKCLDIDECLIDWKCPVNSVCKNIAGGVECQCKQGYRKMDSKCVLEANNCGGNTCSEHAHCNELLDTCYCKPGYQGNGLVCSDTDECQDSSYCNQDNEKCKNSVGSFQCLCKDSYFRKGTLCVEREEKAEDEEEENHENGDDGYYLAPNGNRYKSYGVHLAWWNAVAQCNADGARLSLKRFDLSQHFDESQSIWLNAKRSAGQSVWKMSDGSDVVNFQWAKGLPIMHAQFDACVYSDQDGWKDTNCPHVLPFICEKESSKTNVDICNAACGENGERAVTDNGVTSVTPCNRFQCYTYKLIQKAAICIHLPSPYLPNVEERLLGQLQWNEDDVMHALNFVTKWKPLVNFDAFWKDESCLGVEGLKENYNSDLLRVHATREKLTSMITYLRALYDCNSNTHIRHQLIQLYKKVLSIKWRIDVQLQKNDILQRIDSMAQICAGNGWFALAEMITFAL